MFLLGQAHPPVAMAEFEEILKILRKYVSEARSEVDYFLANASLQMKQHSLTKMKMDRDILAEYVRAVEEYRPLSADVLLRQKTKGSTEFVHEPETMVVNFESALPIIHEARVIQIQLRHIIPIFESEKERNERLCENNDDLIGFIHFIKELYQSKKVTDDKKDQKTESIQPEVQDKENEFANSGKFCETVGKQEGSMEKKVEETFEDEEQDAENKQEDAGNKENAEDTEEDIEDSEEEAEDIDEEAYENEFMKYFKNIKEDSCEHLLKVSEIIPTKTLKNLSLFTTCLQIVNKEGTDGSFLFVVRDISTLQFNNYSPECTLGNFHFQFYVCKWVHESSIGIRNLEVGMCCADVLGSCCLDVQLILLPQKYGVKAKVRTISRLFSFRHELNYLFRLNFIDWDELMNLSTGYIKDNKIILLINIRLL